VVNPYPAAKQNANNAKEMHCAMTSEDPDISRAPDESRESSDPALLEKGRLRLEWARDHMPVLSRIAERLREERPLEGLNISMALHVEAKTGILALTLKEAGANVRLASCNPLSTDDSVAQALNEIYSLPTYARKGESKEEYYGHLEATLEVQPDIVIDDGCDLINMLHTTHRHLLPGVKGANEETTTGIVRLRAMEKAGELEFPVMSVNDAAMKHFFDNRYGTGQSTFDGIFNATNLLIAGKDFVVAGYGWCGRGIAMRAQGMGARVIVTEVDPVRALEASMDGFRVMPMRDAAALADFIVTVTGNRDIVDGEIFGRLKDGCVVANSGHFNNELDLEWLAANSKARRRVREFIEEFTLVNGRKVNVLADGRLVNLAAGQGHPAEIMDMSFALQALATEFLARNHGELEPGVHDVPAELDERVARLKLESMDVRIDSLTETQRNYLESWDQGT